MRVLIAFDKFKDAISAKEACDVAASALRRIRPEWELDLCPLSDGGDGFEAVVSAAVGARRISVDVCGPRGAVITSGLSLARLDRFPQPARDELMRLADLRSEAGIAIIEMAQASGLALLRPDERDLWKTTTYGTGQLIRAAANAGAEAIILGVGGSATHDLGLGALNALGLEFRSTGGETISPATPSQWHEIASIEGGIVPPLPPLLLASDVTNPLLGPLGAAVVFGPQKGLRPEALPTLEAESTRMAQVLCSYYQKPMALVESPGTGAAGGIAFGFLCAGKDQLQSGFSFIAQLVDLEGRLQAADIVITGEGRFDESSGAGKGPGEVIRRANVLGKPVHLFAGRVSNREMKNVLYYEISPHGMNHRTVLNNTATYLGKNVAAAFDQ